MHLRLRSLGLVMVLTLLTLLGLTFSGTQNASDPVIDLPPVYLPAIMANYPDYLPPPIEAKKTGWLRKWRASRGPNHCLEASGTRYYLERERGEAGWLAAVADTEFVSETELEVHLDKKVAITGTAEFFDAACDFPRLNARTLEVVEVTPDGVASRP